MYCSGAVSYTHLDVYKRQASNRAWNYLFGLLRHYYRTGHHDDNYIFPELKIGSAYVADSLIIGNSSDGYQFVFVELEAPTGRITKEKGTRFGEVSNKGIEQVRDWQMYIAANWNVKMCIRDRGGRTTKVFCPPCGGLPPPLR